VGTGRCSEAVVRRARVRGSVCRAICPAGWCSVTGCHRHALSSRVETTCPYARWPGWVALVSDPACGSVMVSRQACALRDVMRQSTALSAPRGLVDLRRTGHPEQDLPGNARRPGRRRVPRRLRVRRLPRHPGAGRRGTGDRARPRKHARRCRPFPGLGPRSARAHSSVSSQPSCTLRRPLPPRGTQEWQKRYATRVDLLADSRTR
jgi:hypothetical protein